MTLARSWLVAVLPIAACTTYVDPPAVPLAGVDADAAWARVLAERVDEDGAIDFAGLRADSRDLDVCVATLARSDPRTDAERFPTRAHELAFHVNSYNALAMYNVLHAGVLPVETAQFFYFRALRLGGRWISLYAYENDVIRPLGEERLHFALNCMVRGCPRLPQVPFRADTLEAQLDAAAREFCNATRHVDVRPAERKVRLSQILEFYTEDFLAKAPSLIDYCNRYRDEPIPTDYSVEFIPYDWTLNQSTRETGPNASPAPGADVR